ncbi:MAG: hypothetical protein ACFCAD_11010, partial [Pleurocapsa sp.]
MQKFKNNFSIKKLPVFLSLMFAMLPIACSPPTQGQLPKPNRREGQPPPKLENRTITQTKGSPKLYPATEPPIAENKVSIKVDGEWRILESNDIPEHNTGQFPNDGNHNAISELPHTYRVPAHPQLASNITEGGWVFGVALNGVPFDPGAEEF